MLMQFGTLSMNVEQTLQDTTHVLMLLKLSGQDPVNLMRPSDLALPSPRSSKSIIESSSSTIMALPIKWRQSIGRVFPRMGENHGLPPCARSQIMLGEMAYYHC